MKYIYKQGMSNNSFLKVLVLSAVFYLSHKIYARKRGKKETVIQYVDVPIDDYDDHQGGVSDIDMQTCTNLIYNSLPWSYYKT